MRRLRGQLSVEFLVYLTVAVAGMLIAVQMFATASAKVNVGLGSAYVQEFFGSAASVAGYSSAKFQAYVPQGLCSIPSEVANYSEAVGMPVLLDNSVCAYSGEALLQSNLLPNGTYLIRVVG